MSRCLSTLRGGGLDNDHDGHDNDDDGDDDHGDDGGVPRRGRGLRPPMASH